MYCILWWFYLCNCGWRIGIVFLIYLLHSFCRTDCVSLHALWKDFIHIVCLLWVLKAQFTSKLKCSYSAVEEFHWICIKGFLLLSLCRLRCLVKQLDKGEVNVVDLRKNIEYAASVLEAVYIDETRWVMHRFHYYITNDILWIFLYCFFKGFSDVYFYDAFIKSVARLASLMGSQWPSNTRHCKSKIKWKSYEVLNSFPTNTKI